MKNSPAYICQPCETRYSRWMGRCHECQAWDSIVEQAAPSFAPKKATKGSLINFCDISQEVHQPARYACGIAEFDRVCGNGLVPGSVVLVGGDPGIGKSTLLLQVAAGLSQNLSCAYISGEEAVTQIKMRAQRMQLHQSNVKLSANSVINDIIETVNKANDFQVLIIDSVQTMFMANIDSSPGSITQVRAVTQELINLAKTKNLVVILVSHVTKEGVIAGPRLLEHMVDTVLYFEGERSNQFRILRTVKNRFGPTHEIGVFVMREQGLIEVTNPSELLISERSHNVPGNVIYCGMEGTRPLLVEIQALVAPVSSQNPRRTVIGWDLNRLAMIIAILETRCDVKLANKDIFLNVVGGIKIVDTGADLAVAFALISAASDRPIAANIVTCGEVGLAAEIRNVNHIANRLNEAAKLGFAKAYIPKLKHPEELAGVDGITVKQIRSLTDLPLRDIVISADNNNKPLKKTN